MFSFQTLNSKIVRKVEYWLLIIFKYPEYILTLVTNLNAASFPGTNLVN